MIVKYMFDVEYRLMMYNLPKDVLHSLFGMGAMT